MHHPPGEDRLARTNPPPAGSASPAARLSAISRGIFEDNQRRGPIVISEHEDREEQGSCSLSPVLRGEG